MKKVFAIITLVYSFVTAQELTLTLEESLDIGLKNSKGLIISEAHFKKAIASRKEISSIRLPSISLNARYSRLSDVPPFRVDIPILPNPFIIQDTYLNNYNLIASVEQPLFTGFRLSSMISAADYIINAEEAKHIGKRKEKANEIHQAFWKLYTSQQIKSLVNQNLKLLNSHLNNTKRLLENGLATKNDLLKLMVEVANLELKLVDAQNHESLAKASFNKIIGLPLDAFTQISVEKIIIEKIESRLNELLEEAETNRNELQATKLILNSLEKIETAAKSDWYPQLYAFGNFYYNNPNQRYLPLEDKFNDSWDIGVALKWNIWNWGGTSAKVEQARQEYLAADNNLKILKENVQLDVYNNYLNLEKAYKKIELSKLQLESAEENYRITDRKYYQQLATSTDLIDAETSLLNAKISLVTSEVEYKIGLSNLDTSLGRNITYK